MADDANTLTRHPVRFRTLLTYTGEVLVVCPACGGRASNNRRPDLPPPRYPGHYLSEPRRLVCAECGAADDWVRARDGWISSFERGGRLLDPNFNQPLWLQVRCAGHVLWALNSAHTDQLVTDLTVSSGGRRTEPTSAMFPVLPLWMKRASHRAAVLSGLARLRVLADCSSPSERSDAAF